MGRTGRALGAYAELCGARLNSSRDTRSEPSRALAYPEPCPVDTLEHTRDRAQWIPGEARVSYAAVVGTLGVVRHMILLKASGSEAAPARRAVVAAGTWAPSCGACEF